MRQISRFTLALLISGLSVGVTATVQAQSNTKNGQRPTQPAVPAGQKTQSTTKQQVAPQNARPPKAEEKRAVPPPNADDETTPELDEILDRWEAESAKIKKIHGKQTRSEINRVFKTEKISKGPFFLEMPDRGRIDLEAVKFKKTDVSTTTDKTGAPFDLESAESTRWICTGDFLWMIDDDKHQYQKQEIPEEQRGANIVNSPLPFLFGMKADEAKERYQLKLVADSKEACQILAIPRMEKDRQNYQKALISLHKKTYLPTKVRLMDPQGQEVSYTFESVKVNDKGWMDFWKEDPYRPSLRGYTKYIPSDDPVEVTPPPSKSAPKDTRGSMAGSTPSKRPVQSASMNNGSTQKK